MLKDGSKQAQARGQIEAPLNLSMSNQLTVMN